MGGLPDEGQMTATSLVVPFSPDPVLSPTRQSRGSPARSLVSPVLLPISQPTRYSWEAGDKALPVTSVRRLASIARGDVVSRGSSGTASLRAGSLRSSRVTLSPNDRA